MKACCLYLKQSSPPTNQGASSSKAPGWRNFRVVRAVKWLLSFPSELWLAAAAVILMAYGALKALQPSKDVNCFG